MAVLCDLKSSVAALPPADFARLALWFEAHQAGRFDDAITNDVREGRLDSLADEALREIARRTAE